MSRRAQIIETPTCRMDRVLFRPHESDYAPIGVKNDIKGILVAHERRSSD